MTRARSLNDAADPMMSEKTTSEHDRLREAREGTAPWRKWGPYLK